MFYDKKLNLLDYLPFSFSLANYIKFTLYAQRTNRSSSNSFSRINSNHGQNQYSLRAKGQKIIEETKKKEKERLVSEQAPPAAKAKEKPDRIPLPNEKKEEKNNKKETNPKNQTRNQASL